MNKLKNNNKIITVKRKPRECNFNASIKNGIYNDIFNKKHNNLDHQQESELIKSASIKALLNNNPILNTCKETVDYPISGGNVITFQQANHNRKNSVDVAEYHVNNYKKHYVSNQMRDILSSQTKPSKYESMENTSKITQSVNFAYLNRKKNNDDHVFFCPPRKLNNSNSVQSICFNEKKTKGKITENNNYDKINNQTLEVISLSNKNTCLNMKSSKFKQNYIFDNKTGWYYD